MAKQHQSPLGLKESAKAIKPGMGSSFTRRRQTIDTTLALKLFSPINNYSDDKSDHTKKSAVFQTSLKRNNKSLARLLS